MKVSDVLAWTGLQIPIWNHSCGGCFVSGPLQCWSRYDAMPSQSAEDLSLKACTCSPTANDAEAVAADSMTYDPTRHAQPAGSCWHLSQSAAVRR